MSQVGAGAQVAQQAVAGAVARDGTELLLDHLQRLARPPALGQVQQHREGGGEPADGTGEVDASLGVRLDERFAPVTLQVNQEPALARPALEGPGQGRQQDVVDLRVVDRRDPLQQGAGVSLREGDGDGAQGVFGVLPAGQVYRQTGHRGTGVRQPVGSLALEGVSSGRPPPPGWPSAGRRSSSAAAGAIPPARSDGRRSGDLPAALARRSCPRRGDGRPAAGAGAPGSRRPAGRRAGAGRHADRGPLAGA